jgi:hypothetical protein
VRFGNVCGAICVESVYAEKRPQTMTECGLCYVHAFMEHKALAALLLLLLCEEFSQREQDYGHHGQFDYRKTDHRKTSLVFHLILPECQGRNPG